MSNPSLKIEAHGTSSSLVPGSIQNARNNDIELVIFNLQVEAEEKVGDFPQGYEFIGSTITLENDATIEIKVVTTGPGPDVDLLSFGEYTKNTLHPLLASLSNPITAGAINIQAYNGIEPGKVTLRLFVRKKL